MRRRLLLLVVVLGAGVLLALVTLPWWLGAAVAWAGPSRGLTFAAYERVGYGRFALRDAEYRRGNVRVTLTRAEADTPLLWLWHHATKHGNAINGGDWLVEVTPSAAPTPPNPNTPRGWVPLRAQLQKIAAQLERFLPDARLGAGVVRWPGGELALRSVEWKQRKLNATGVSYRNVGGDATVVFGADDRLSGLVRNADGGWTVSLDSRGPALTADLTWAEQPAHVDATFAAQGWLPATADLTAANWSVPGERLKLAPLYRAVRGSAQLAWAAGTFKTDITATGDPVPGQAAPPLSIALRGQGDLGRFTLETLEANLPGIVARLSAPVTVERSGRIAESAATFNVQAALDQIPWFKATGRLTGEARLVSGFSPSPVVEFSWSARDVAASGVAVQAVSGKGRLDWPRVTIAEGLLVGTGGEALTWKGGYDIRARALEHVTLQGEVLRTSLARWLPAQPEFKAVKIEAEADGALREVAHRGKLQVSQVTAGKLQPTDVALSWTGRGAEITEFNADLAAGEGRIRLGGAANMNELQLTRLAFAHGSTERLQLAAPAVVRFRPQLQLDGVRLTGGESSLVAAATWGASGRVTVSASALPLAWFTDFIAIPGPPVTVTLLALNGTWDRGPMTFTLTAGASVDIAEGRRAAAHIATRGDGQAVTIEALRATEADATVVNATGRLPVTISPGGREFLHIDNSGPLQLDATVAPNSAFWEKLAAVSGVQLDAPQAEAHLRGTWLRPEGTAVLKAARIALDPKRVARPLPTIGALDVELTGDRAGVTLSRFFLEVEGQAVRAQGRLPIPDGDWQAIVKQPLAAAQNGADLRLEIPDAEVAVFARFLPAVLAPKGRLHADVQYRQGGLEGFLTLRDAASRPLGPLGVLQEINADIALSGRKLALRGVTAKSGGQPVKLAGTFELPPQGEPRFDLTLRGENLPFVRQTGLLLRGDLDLKLQTPSEGPPRLSGTVRLRDSLFLSDVRAFIPKGGAANPARRPPYFSIDTPPVNNWGLAVDVIGERFLRLRTPVFVGVASARFRLGGTLGEPRAIGEIALDEGNVRMPFASFAIQQGSIRLTEADPYEPAIYLRGTTRRYGYDLAMELEGTATQPNVVFSSSPALESEQVLLMVMTGAAPSSDVNKSSTQRVASIGYFLGQSLLGSVGSDAADADRLMISSGEKISIAGRETYDIEYKLSDRWTLTGEYNEFDEYNAGVKWRVFRGPRGPDVGTHEKK